MKRIGIVYLIVSFSLRPRPYRKAIRLAIYKIGKSQLGRRYKRLAEINKSTPGSLERIVFFAPAPAFWLESLFRKVYSNWKYTYKGSGKTEYVWPEMPWWLLVALAVGLEAYLGYTGFGILFSILFGVLLPDMLVVLPVLFVMLLCWAVLIALIIGIPAGLVLLILSFA